MAGFTEVFSPLYVDAKYVDLTYELCKEHSQGCWVSDRASLHHLECLRTVLVFCALTSAPTTVYAFRQLGSCRVFGCKLLPSMVRRGSLTDLIL